MFNSRFCVDESEKRRILQLHETATKNNYLFYEQTTSLNTGDKVETSDDDLKIWYLCGQYYVTNNNETYLIQDWDQYRKTSQSPMKRIPKRSEVGGQVINGNWVWNEVTKVGVELGKQASQSPSCGKKTPTGGYNTDVEDYIIFLDDWKKTFTATEKKPKGEMVVNNYPVYSWVNYTANNRQPEAGGGDALSSNGMEFSKKDNGVVIFDKRHTKSFRISFADVTSAQALTPSKPDTPDIPDKPSVTTETPLKLDLESPFKFDQTVLQPTAEAKFVEFTNKLKDYVSKYAEKQIKIDISCYASIDGDPTQKVGSFSSRKDYDMDLSRRRAETIKKRILDSVQNAKNVTVVAQGKGQTTQFNNIGYGKQGFTGPSSTSPNRRLIVAVNSN